MSRAASTTTAVFFFYQDARLLFSGRKKKRPPFQNSNRALAAAARERSRIYRLVKKKNEKKKRTRCFFPQIPKTIDRFIGVFRFIRVAHKIDAICEYNVSEEHSSAPAESRDYPLLIRTMGATRRATSASLQAGRVRKNAAPGCWTDEARLSSRQINGQHEEEVVVVVPSELDGRRAPLLTRSRALKSPPPFFSPFFLSFPAHWLF